MRILVDTKNLALYGGGIAHWFSPLLEAWIAHRPDVHFLLAGPPFDTAFLPERGNWEYVPLFWPEWLPRPLRHPWYDNMLFPRAVARLRPDLVMSPYHDVRIFRSVPSVIGVHDLCLDELGAIYPRRIRSYYLALLRHNLRRAAYVITVSETSRNKLVERYGIVPERVGVVYNTLPIAFEGVAEDAEVDGFRKRYCPVGRLLFYPGGSEYRKNVARLVQAYSMLAQRDDGLVLLVTGNLDARWGTALAQLPDTLSQRVIFTGRLSDNELRLAYAAATAVVYPSLCEGFGRVCLEAMETGTPLACSDLPVMREVAGDCAHYFDPYNVDAMNEAITSALLEGRRNSVRDTRFQTSTVRASFLVAMNQFQRTNP